MRVIIKLKDAEPVVYEGHTLAIVRDNGFTHIKRYREEWLNVITFNDNNFEYIKWEES